MINDLSIKQSGLPGEQRIEQTGGHNVNVTNQEGGQVIFNVNMPSNSGSSPARDMIAVKSFSKKYYQLIVTGEEDVFQNQYVSVLADRALNQWYAPPEIVERCGSLTDEGIAELMTFPAIICRENTDYNGNTDPNQWAVYGYITRVKPEGKIIKIAFHTLGVVNQRKMCEKKNAIYFDLNVDCALTDLNHSAWYVHKVNLFEAFDEAGIKGLPRPD